MSSPRPSVGGAVALALATSVTVALTVGSWRGFTEAGDDWIGAFLLAGVAITLLGAGLRWVRVPLPLIGLAQLGLGGAYLALVTTGSPLPVGERWSELRADFVAAQESIRSWAAPVPVSADSIVPILLGCALLVLVTTDLVAAGVRSVPLAGLVLLTASTVPVGLLGEGVGWLSFVLTALGFLAMLYIQEHEQLSRWGRSLAGRGDGRADSALVSTPYRATALITAVVAAVAAALVGAAVPTLDTTLFDGGRGPGGGDVRVVNPMVDLRRDLNRGRDVDLITIETDDPDPAYLRMTALTRFSDNEWSPGDREIPETNRADGGVEMPAPIGVNPTVERSTHSYDFSATSAFGSTWLPTFSEAVFVDAPGDWTFDVNTRDFLSPEGDAGAAGGLEWGQQADRLIYDPVALERAPSAVGQVSASLTELPDSYPNEATTLAIEVTSGADSQYEKAVLLQRWFQQDGGFTYNLDVSPGNGSDDLMAFLREGEGGREGYCEQFAAAMAAMGRSLGIPSRVAVGFLRPSKVGNDRYVYSSHDLHAWPEMYFPGSGWVAFEPTPTSHTQTLPSYTQNEFEEDPDVPSPTSEPSSSAPTPSPTAQPTAAPEEQTAEDGGAEGSPFPWRWVLAAVLVLALLAALALTPRLVRSSRRTARARGAGAEDAWAELRDTATDLGLPWPDDTSPRAVSRLLGPWMGAVGNHDERPRTSRQEHPEAAAALDRIALEVERSRYARPGSWEAAGLWPDVELVVEGWTYGAGPSARRRAHWWPRSVLRRRPVPVTVEHTTRSDEVEHVQ